jgi:hypothetical protein
MIKSRKMRWAGHVAGMRRGGEEECIWVISWKAKRKEITRKPKCRWVVNIKMDTRGLAWGGMDWIDLAKDRDQ